MLLYFHLDLSSKHKRNLPTCPFLFFFWSIFLIVPEADLWRMLLPVS